MGEDALHEAAGDTLLDNIGQNLKCTFCGKAWHQVERIVTKGNSAICDACVRELSALIDDDAESAR